MRVQIRWILSDWETQWETGDYQEMNNCDYLMKFIQDV